MTPDELIDWLIGLPAPMLLEAVKSAFFTFVVDFGQRVAGEGATGALWDAWLHCKDPKEFAALQQELRDLYASAWRDDVPEEDREWAESYRHACMDEVNGRRRSAVAQRAYEAYLQSSDGLFDGQPARPWPSLPYVASDPWRAFVDAVEDAPEGESELATAEAAAREYWHSLYREAPRWDSDPAKTHWLAAVRAARKALAGDVPPDTWS
ncbi:hypothetical protein [Sorangium sp. So ce233]|uniref:hypothetical protein n=1 Tax=Sorangium sp. So ce233 TaxID=3133290 RepID=UPI003F63F8AF